jgi:alanyl-tRNA synthetase
MIEQSLPVVTEVMDLESAKNTGAIALFDEKYGDSVRVVSMGDVSKDFCGGTHVSNTSEIGLFKIVSEESIGSGVRRITSVTKMRAYEAFKEEERYLYETAALLKMANWNGFKEKLQGLLDENAALKKENAAAKETAMMAEAAAQTANAEDVNGIHVLILRLKDQNTGTLKNYAETLRNRLENGFVFLSNEANGKLTFVCASSKEAIARGLKAGDIARKAAQITGGNGGGRPDMAQAGGRDLDKIEEAFASVRAAVDSIR